MHDLLEPLAPQVDLEEGWRTVAGRLLGERRRRRAVRLAGALAVIALAAGGAALALRSGDGVDQRVTTVPQPGTPDHREATVDLPPGWHQAPEVLTPDLTDPHEVLAVATYPLRANGPEHCSHVPGAAIDDLGVSDAFVWIARPAETFAAPSIDTYQLPIGSEGDPEIPACSSRDRDYAYGWGAYSVDGEAVYVLVALGAQVSDDTRAETLAVVHSLTLDEPAPGEGLPAGWQEAGEVLTPHLGGPYRLWEVAAFGTYDLLPNGANSRCAQWPVTAIEDLGPTDALVWIIQPTFADPYPDRPDPITQLPTGPQEQSETLACVDRPADFAFDTYRFNDGGRNYIVLVALGDAATEETKVETLQVLNGLDFGPPHETFDDPSAGVSVDYPTGWNVTPDSLTAPIRGGGPGSEDLVTLSTGPLLSDHLDCEGSVCSHPCPSYPTRAIEAMGTDGALVWVEEDFAADVGDLQTRREVDVLPFADADVPSGCADVGAVPGSIGFVDAGRAIVVHVAVGPEASDQTKAEALDIINSLEFGPR